MERKWFIISGGRQVGPMTADELRNYGLSADSMVWTAGMSDWRPARECAALATLLCGSEGACVDVESENSAGYTRNIDVDADAASPGNAAGRPQYPGGNGSAPYGRRVPDPENPGNWTQGGYDNGYGYGNGYGGGFGSGSWSGKSKVVAGLLAIFLGYLGIQYFYCGKITGGLLTILLTLVTCGTWSVITLIQGIYMLTLSDREFDNKFVYTTSSFPIF